MLDAGQEKERAETNGLNWTQLKSSEEQIDIVNCVLFSASIRPIQTAETQKHGKD